MKMYILVRENAPRGHAINSVGHAGLCAYLEWKDDPDMQEWVEYSFKKVTCKVTEEELDQACDEADDFLEIVEDNLNNELMCIVFKPRLKFPEFFNTLKLYS